MIDHGQFVLAASDGTRLPLTSNTSCRLSSGSNKRPSALRSEAAVTTSHGNLTVCLLYNAMIQSKVPESKKVLPGEAYLFEEAKSVVPKAVFIILRDDGFDMYANDDDVSSSESIAYAETLIRCSLNQIPTSEKPHVIQLEAGLRTIFICFTDSIDRDDCFTKILASVGQFLVLNPRSKTKPILGKKISNPLSPVPPLTLSAWPSTKQVHLSLLLNALDISSSPCIPSANRGSSSFSFRFPGMLVSLCNAKARRGHAKDAKMAVKTPVARSYTLPFSKHSVSLSCKQYSGTRTSILSENNGRTSLETRAALGILNIDSGDMRQYLSRI